MGVSDIGHTPSQNINEDFRKALGSKARMIRFNGTVFRDILQGTRRRILPGLGTREFFPHVGDSLQQRQEFKVRWHKRHKV